MPYLVMLAVLAIWAFVALRDRPVAYYLSIFFACSLLTFAAEPTNALLFHLYEWRLDLFSNLRLDLSFGSLVIGFFLDPLLGVLFARYAAGRTVLKATVAALILGYFEVWLHHRGYILYAGWQPLFSVLAFLGYFLIVWRLTLRIWPVPHWLHVLGFAVWQLYLSDLVLQGQLQLSRIQLTTWNWERLTSLILRAFLVAPFATWIAVRPLTRRWLWGAAALMSQLAVVLLLGALGFLNFGWLGLAAGLLAHALIIWLTVQYSEWLQQQVPATAPPPWEPPVRLR